LFFYKIIYKKSAQYLVTIMVAIYLVLASEEPITGAIKIFNQDGVDSGAVSRGGDDNNPLLVLLDMGNIKSRGNPQALPTNWNLRKYSFVCVLNSESKKAMLAGNTIQLSFMFHRNIW